MSMLQATLVLYRDSLGDAGKGLGRSVWAVAALLLGFVAMLVASMLLAPLGIVGGFLLGLLQAAVIGWYLSLVEIGVAGLRRVTLHDLKDNLGVYLWDVISVMFIFWIGSMLLGPLLPPHVLAIVTTVCTLLFNPAPEMIYQDRTTSFALLQDAVSFMQRNWPEWLGGQVLGAAVLTAWGYLVFGHLDARLTLQLIEAFGPWFGFVGMGAYALATLKLGGFFGALFLLAFTHFFLLFRGHLYKRLRGSSRRGRAWQARLGG